MTDPAHVALLLGGALINALAVWIILWAILRRQETRERRYRAELLSAQGEGFEALITDLRREVERMTMVFDGMGSAYEGSQHEAKAAREATEALASRVEQGEERVEQIDVRVKRLEDHPALRRVGNVR